MAICRNGAVCFPEKLPLPCRVRSPSCQSYSVAPQGCVPHFGLLSGSCAGGLEDTIFHTRHCDHFWLVQGPELGLVSRITLPLMSFSEFALAPPC